MQSDKLSVASLSGLQAACKEFLVHTTVGPQPHLPTLQGEPQHHTSDRHAHAGRQADKLGVASLSVVMQAASEEVSVQREDASLPQLPTLQGELRHHGSQ